MAVAHSAASESHTGTTGSASQAAFSWTHTQTGTPQGVVVFVSTFVSVADFITSVTYGGVALTRLSGGSAQDAAGELGRMDAFFLGSGLGAGNQTITVNRTNNATVMYAAAVTVTAGAATAVPTATIVLLQGDQALAVQSVNDTSPGQNSVRYAAAYSGLNAPPAAGTGSTLLNSIDIGNYGSALAQETTAGQGARNVGFTAGSDDVAAVHLAIRELVPRTETPIVGSFTLTGNAANLVKASPKSIAADVGTFVLTGNAATLRQNYAIAAEVGTFTTTGQPATLRHNPRIEAATGSFALTGGAPALLRGRYLSGGAGTFTETGQPAIFRRTWAIRPVKGTFTLTGITPALTEIGAYEIDLIVGSFTLTGQSAQLAQSPTLPVDAGTFALTGNAAGTRHNARITGDRGTFNLTGNNATLTKTAADQLSAATGAFNLTGNAAGTRHNVRIEGGTGAFAFTGNAATLTETEALQLNAATGAFVLTGANASLVKSGTARRRNVLIF